MPSATAITSSRVEPDWASCSPGRCSGWWIRWTMRVRSLCAPTLPEHHAGRPIHDGLLVSTLPEHRLHLRLLIAVALEQLAAAVALEAVQGAVDALARDQQITGQDIPDPGALRDAVVEPGVDDQHGFVRLRVPLDEALLGAGLKGLRGTVRDPIDLLPGQWEASDRGHHHPESD